MTDQIVPFGKYRDQPVERLMADRDYCQWLASQPWFRERYATIHNIIVNGGNEPQDSPEHNEMQARFLSDDWRRALLEIINPGVVRTLSIDAVVEHARQRIGNHFGFDGTYQVTCNHEDHEARSFTVVTSSTRSDGSTAAEFEVRGWDVVVEFSPAKIDLSAIINNDGPKPCFVFPDNSLRHLHRDGWYVEETQRETVWTSSSPISSGGFCDACRKHSSIHHDDGRCLYSYTKHWETRASWNLRNYSFIPLHVELKPDLGDDYPTVIRQIKNRNEGVGGGILVARRAMFEMVSFDQVKEVLAASGITLVMESEIITKALELINGASA